MTLSAVPFKYFIKKNIKRIRSKLAKLGVLLGFSPSLHTPDRYVLEQQILPYFAKSTSCKRLLFVGCEWFTKFYQKMFTQQEYWTLDFDPKKRIYGSKLHVCDGFQNIDRHFESGSLDLIVCNGVFGWGLDKPAEINLAFLQAYHCLREGGILIVGWNDVPEHRPMNLDEVDSLKKFSPYSFPLLSTSRYRTGSENFHVYDFYKK